MNSNAPANPDEGGHQRQPEVTTAQFTPGFLGDADIKAALKLGDLIEEGTHEESCIRHASYMLRLGEEVRIAEADHSEKRLFTIHPLKAGGNITIGPGQTAMLYSIEKLRFPKNVLGFTVARGLLFTEGLTPENTYVDPGFSGSIYTTVTNVSNRLITLPYGLPVARLFFFRLSTDVAQPYKSGAAQGISQQLESVKSVAIGTPDACRTASLPQIISEIRKTPISGMHLSEYCSRNITRQAQLFVFAVIWPVFLAIANHSDSIQRLLNGPIVSNFIAGVLAFLVTAGIPRLIKTLRKL